MVGFRLESSKIDFPVLTFLFEALAIVSNYATFDFQYKGKYSLRISQLLKQ